LLNPRCIRAVLDVDSRADGSLQVLALTETHLLHVRLPFERQAGGVEGQTEVLRAPLALISNVRSTSTGGLLIAIAGDWCDPERTSEPRGRCFCEA